MDDQDKAKEQLIEELADLRQQVAALQESEERTAIIVSDITEQNRMQDALQESEERFRKIFEEGQIGILLVDTNGRIQRASRRFCEMLGYSEAEIIALGLAAISHPDDWERDYPFVSRLWCGVISHYQVEKRYLRKDGQAVWAQLTGSLMHDETGRPINIIGMVEDITERKQAKERLQNSERVLRTLIDASPESIVLIGTDGTTLLVNETAAHRFGTTVDELVGKTPADVVPPEVAAKRMWHLHEVIRTGKAVRFEDERLGRCMENAVHPIFDEQGKVAAAAVFSIDLTDRKQAEKALQKAHDEMEQRVEERTSELSMSNKTLRQEIEHRKQAEEALNQSEEKYRTLVETSPDTIVLVDLEGNVNFASRGILALSGPELVQDIIGKKSLDFIAPEDQQRFQANFRETLEAGVTRAVEYTFLRQDGSRFPGEVTAALIRDGAGRPSAIMAIVRDVTERKRAQEKLRKEHRILKHLLQASDRERQLIAYEIHDELAQHLTGAIMEFQTFSHLKETKPQLAAKAFDAGTTMLQQSHYEVRRLIAGVRPPILDEQGVVAAVGHLVNEQIRLKGPKIDYHSRVDFDRLAPTLENSIYRIAQEGLANARHYSKSEKVRLSLLQLGDRVRIEIRDWGIGFNTKTVRENHFGLEGIQQRARLLGGKCSIRSATGQGTRITVELPVVERETE